MRLMKDIENNTEHTVWIDKYKLKGGDDWCREIKCKESFVSRCAAGNTAEAERTRVGIGLSDSTISPPPQAV